MNYKEVTINCAMDGVDAMCDHLTELGMSGFVIENENDFHDFLENNPNCWDYVDQELENSFRGVSRVKLYLNEDEEGMAQLKTLQAEYPNLTVKRVQDSDWENNWRQFYQPIEIGNRLVVVPQWENNPCPERIPLLLDPGLIFGTGSHATTRTCLEMLDSMNLTGKKVLDLGCGSGILGIGAVLLGAKSVLSVDIDPKAPNVVRENAELNGIGPDRLQVFAGDVLGNESFQRKVGSGYDLVLANIVSDVIIALAPRVKNFLAAGGCFICSGIIDGREDEVEAALQAAGVLITEKKHLGEWNTFACMCS